MKISLPRVDSYSLIILKLCSAKPGDELIKAKRHMIAVQLVIWQFFAEH